MILYFFQPFGLLLPLFISWRYLDNLAFFQFNNTLFKNFASPFFCYLYMRNFKQIKSDSSVTDLSEPTIK